MLLKNINGTDDVGASQHKMQSAKNTNGKIFQELFCCILRKYESDIWKRKKSKSL